MMMKKFAQHIETIINNETKTYNELLTSDEQLLLMLESELAIDELQTLAGKFVNLDFTPNTKVLKRFQDLYRNRSERIANTDAIYMHNPTSLGNVTYYKAWRRMVESAVLENDYRFMVTSINADNNEGNPLVFNVPLHQLVLSDDNKTFIDVYDCIRNAVQQQNKKLYATHPIDVSHRELSKAECERVIKHSQKCEKVYQGISVLSEAKQKSLCNDLLSSFKRPFNSVGYGAKGWALLKRRLSGDMSKNDYEFLKKFIAKKVKDIDLLVSLNVLFPDLPWLVIYKGLPVDFLKNIVNPQNDIAAVIKNKANYSDCDARNKAIMLLFKTCYSQERKAQPEYLSYSGYFFGSSLTDKNKACELFDTFFTSKTNKLADYIAYVDTVQEKNVQHALKNDRLGCFYQMVQELSPPQPELAKAATP